MSCKELLVKTTSVNPHPFNRRGSPDCPDCQSLAILVMEPVVETGNPHPSTLIYETGTPKKKEISESICVAVKICQSPPPNNWISHAAEKFPPSGFTDRRARARCIVFPDIALSCIAALCVWQLFPPCPGEERPCLGFIKTSPRLSGQLSTKKKEKEELAGDFNLESLSINRLIRTSCPIVGSRLIVFSLIESVSVTFESLFWILDSEVFGQDLFVCL